MFVVRAQDSGPHPRWSGSYHINDVDPDAAQDLEVFVYNAATGEPELIGKGSGVHQIIWDACRLPHSELRPSLLMSCKYTRARFWHRQLISYPDINQRSVHDPVDSSQSDQVVQVVCYQPERQWHPIGKLHLSVDLHSPQPPTCASRNDG